MSSSDVASSPVKPRERAVLRGRATSAHPSHHDTLASVVKVAVAGDDPLVTYGLRAMLLPYRDVIRVQDLDSGKHWLGPVDITLYDPTRPSRERLTLQRLLADPANGLVVMYSLTPPPGTVHEMLARGCAGFVDQAVSTRELVDALTCLGGRRRDETAGPSAGADRAGQEYGLSPREVEVLSLITQGFTNEDISSHLYLSTNTIKTYIRSAYRKVGVTRRAQAVRWGMEHGMGGSRHLP